MYIGIWRQDVLKERDHLEVLGAHGRRLLKSGDNYIRVCFSIHVNMWGNMNYNGRAGSYKVLTLLQDFDLKEDSGLYAGNIYIYIYICVCVTNIHVCNTFGL
jgi:hypothetical protein